MVINQTAKSERVTGAMQPTCVVVGQQTCIGERIQECSYHTTKHNTFRVWSLTIMVHAANPSTSHRNNGFSNTTFEQHTWVTRLLQAARVQAKFQQHWCGLTVHQNVQYYDYMLALACRKWQHRARQTWRVGKEATFSWYVTLDTERNKCYILQACHLTPDSTTWLRATWATSHSR